MAELAVAMLLLVAAKALLGFHFPWEKCECCGQTYRDHPILDVLEDPILATDNLDPTWCPTCHQMWEECKCCGICGEMCNRQGPGGCQWGDE